MKDVEKTVNLNIDGVKVSITQDAIDSLKDAGIDAVQEVTVAIKKHLAES